MKSSLFRFSINLAILSLALVIIAFAVNTLAPHMITPALPWLLSFFIISTFLIYYLLINASKGKFNKFTNTFMAATVIKLLVMLTVVAVYVYLHKSDAIRFVITMFVLYLAYTLLEITALLKFNKVR
ncbi:MAG: hypothetical protein IPH88_03100 [Bacteroidales bacterium]|nr:hypothetical protein [Bacteroidales bacterium]